jgi:hypothetical protein
MGVKGLWELLAPCGRRLELSLLPLVDLALPNSLIECLLLYGYRVSIETLDGKVVAVDASIWITQFIKVPYTVTFHLDNLIFTVS